ncbi:hypothetical protein Tco_0370753 [Tanacetum coccineum]
MLQSVVSKSLLSSDSTKTLPVFKGIRNLSGVGAIVGVLLKERRDVSSAHQTRVFSHSLAFGGTYTMIGHIEEKRRDYDLHLLILEEVLLIERGDSVASIKRRRRDLFSDGQLAFVERRQEVGPTL